MKNTIFITNANNESANQPVHRHSLGPVFQSIHVSLTSSLVAKMLTVLVSTISNSQVFLLKKMRVAFANANAKATHIFFQQKLIMLYLMIKVLTIL